MLDTRINLVSGCIESRHITDRATVPGQHGYLLRIEKFIELSDKEALEIILSRSLNLLVEIGRDQK